MKFNAGGPDGLIDRKAPGQPSKLTEAHRAALNVNAGENMHRRAGVKMHHGRKRGGGGCAALVQSSLSPDSALQFDR
jgi:hypothetical protein